MDKDTLEDIRSSVATAILMVGSLLVVLLLLKARLGEVETKKKPKKSEATA